MKHLNAHHNVILETTPRPVSGSNPKDGDICPHNETVYNCILYHEVFNYCGALTVTKIELKPKMIRDLAKQIEEIESKVTELPYEDEDLPF